MKTSRSLVIPLVVIGRSLIGLLVIGAAIVGSASIVDASVQNPSTTTVQTWKQALADLPQPSTGCFTASYPVLQWHATHCNTLAKPPLDPASGKPVAAPRIVGGGGLGDYSLYDPAGIKEAVGQFTNVSPNITESGPVDGKGLLLFNTFSLQLNSQTFDTPACAGNGNPNGTRAVVGCQGWEQFVYLANPGPQIFVQFWLINYDASCPFPSLPGAPPGDCYMNSSGISVPGLTAADLADVELSGSAVNAGNDAVQMSFNNEAWFASGSDSILDLAPHWNTVEFGVYGDAGGGRASFGPNTSLEAVTHVEGLVSNVITPPQCLLESFTGETNNLTRTATPILPSSDNDQSEAWMGSEQTKGTTSPASCQVVGNIGAIPNVLTSASPAATSEISADDNSCGLSVSQECVIVAWHGTDANSLWWTSAPETPGQTTYQWAAPEEVSGVGSSTAPALGNYGGDGVDDPVLMAWKGKGSDQRIFYSSLQGGTWSPQQFLPNAGTSTTPAVSGSERRGIGFAMIVWKGKGTDTKLYYATQYGDGAWVVAPHPIPGALTDSSPSLTPNPEILNDSVILTWKVAGQVTIDQSVFSSTSGWSNPWPLKGSGGTSTGVATTTVVDSGSVAAWKAQPGDDRIFVNGFNAGITSGSAQLCLAGISTSVSPALAFPALANTQPLLLFRDDRGTQQIHYMQLPTFG